MPLTDPIKETLQTSEGDNWAGTFVHGFTTPGLFNIFGIVETTLTLVTVTLCYPDRVDHDLEGICQLQI